MAIRRFSGGVLLAAVVAGCSVSSGDDYRYEVAETSLEEAHAELQQTPTQFFVSNQDDRYAWERARYFLENYSGASPSSAVISKIVGARWGMASSAAHAQFSYEVWKDPIASGYQYTIKCAPAAGGDGNAQQAHLNAANLSRFVQQGKLEVSLLGER
jgi:hypothetical protein